MTYCRVLKSAIHSKNIDFVEGAQRQSWPIAWPYKALCLRGSVAEFNVRIFPDSEGVAIFRAGLNCNYSMFDSI